MTQLIDNGEWICVTSDQKDETQIRWVCVMFDVPSTARRQSAARAKFNKLLRRHGYASSPQPALVRWGTRYEFQPVEGIEDARRFIYWVREFNTDGSALRAVQLTDSEFDAFSGFVSRL